MARTDDEVVDIIWKIYRSEFGGKANQRYLISWADLRSLYGFGKLFDSRFNALVEAALQRGLDLFDLGQGETGRMIAVVRSKTIDRWRRVPKRILEEYRLPTGGEEEGEDDLE